MTINIISYLDEFHEDPYKISQDKINILKDFYYKNINKIFPVKRDNFQIGVNKNKNLLFFRDKQNKKKQLILNIIENTSTISENNNIQREYSYSFNSLTLDNNQLNNNNSELVYNIQTSNSFLLQDSIDNLNNYIKKSNKNSKKYCNLCIII
tara:strand:+ start:1792 stop:2247 length:456 start_codon:yes stop_codon:yes gene_type:complete